MSMFDNIEIKLPFEKATKIIHPLSYETKSSRGVSEKVFEFLYAGNKYEYKYVQYPGSGLGYLSCNGQSVYDPYTGGDNDFMIDDLCEDNGIEYPDNLHKVDVLSKYISPFIKSLKNGF